MAWWSIFKQLTDTWNQDLLAQSAETASEQMLDAFVAGQGAMFYRGSWIPNQLALRDLDFELQSFSFPPLDPSVSEYATGANTAGAVGGPNAAYQYAMSTPESNESMNEPGKQEAALDWLHYIGTPEVIERVVNELGSFAPTWPGTTPAPSPNRRTRNCRWSPLGRRAQNWGATSNGSLAFISPTTRSWKA